MKKSRLSLIGAAMMMAATAATPASIASATQTTQNVTQQSNSKATQQKSFKVNRQTLAISGGLTIEGQISYGTSPKEYGLRYGAKKHGKKTNFNRISHNHKIKRRLR